MHPPERRIMKYQNLDLKIDQFVAYVNSDKINLIPSFQRGHVWKLPTRRKLIANIVQGRPIPAIFLYREASGDQYSYNILDGKQRLESLILFIGNERQSLSIQNLNKYFFQKRHRDAANLWIEVEGKKCTLQELNDQLFRELQEYVIPTIEITLSEDNPSSLNEIIDLFVDINSYGEKVKRFDIVKAMSKDACLGDVFAPGATASRARRICTSWTSKARRSVKPTITSTRSTVGRCACSMALTADSWTAIRYRSWDRLILSRISSRVKRMETRGGIL
jgi:hypothetical protein